MSNRAKRHLTPDELAHFQGEGYVVPDFVLPKEELALLQELTLHTLRENEGDLDTPIRQPYIAQEPNDGPPPPGTYVRLNEHRSTRPQEWLQASTFPGILDLTESLIGPDLILWSGVLFHKRALQGPPTPWHRDNGTVPPIKPLAAANVWVAVFDVDVDNGCMRVIPKSHLASDVGQQHVADPNAIINLALDPATFDQGQAVDIELKAGQMLFFDFALVHGTNANTGSRPRSGYSIRYMPASSRFDHDAVGHHDPNRAYDDEAFRTRPLFLVRGQDRAGNDFRRGHPQARVPA